MKRVTASEARRTWFRLLDEVAAGETVLIERRGVRVLLQRESAPQATAPDYAELLSAPSVSEADRWTWVRDDDGELHPDGPGRE